MQPLTGFLTTGFKMTLDQFGYLSDLNSDIACGRGTLELCAITTDNIRLHYLWRFMYDCFCY